MKSRGEKKNVKYLPFFPLQNWSDLILDVPHSMNLRKSCVSHLSNHAMPFIQDLAKFWTCFCSHSKAPKKKKTRTFCCICFEFATLQCQHQLQWAILLESHLHNYPMPFLQIWAEISVMFTLMCIVYAGTGALS